MSTVLDITAYATTAVLAYQLGASNHGATNPNPKPLSPLGGLVAALDLPGKARTVTERLESMTPMAAVAPVAEQVPTVSIASQVPAINATVGAVAAPPAPAPAPAAEGTGLPDSFSPVQAREELKKELNAMNVDAIRAQARKLDPAKKEIFKRQIPNLEKARKDQLIAAMVKAFGL